MNFSKPEMLFSVLLLAIASCIAGDALVQQNGDSIELECKVDGDSIKWRVNGEKTEQTSSSGTGDKMTSILKRTNLSIADAGLYECYRSSNQSLIDNFTLTIISISGESESLVTNVTLAELNCTVDNEDLTVSQLSWKRNGQILNSTEKYSISSELPTTTLGIHKPGKEDAGLYTCVVNIDGMTQEFEQSFSLNTPPETSIEKMRSKVEGETATILCNVTGFPIPEITWYRQLEDSDEMVKVEYDERVNTSESGGVPDAILTIKDLKIKTDRGDYTCLATNFLGTSNTTVSLKVKDKLAAVWPFLGICAEVAILCSIIFIFEKRRNRRMEEEEEVDAVKQDLMNKSNGATEDKDVRQRSNATKA